jgi:hypothetical protein
MRQILRLIGEEIEWSLDCCRLFCIQEILQKSTKNLLKWLIPYIYSSNEPLECYAVTGGFRRTAVMVGLLLSVSILRISVSQ